MAASLASLEGDEYSRIVSEYSYQKDEVELLVMSKDLTRWDELVQSFGCCLRRAQPDFRGYRYSGDLPLPTGLIIVSDLLIDSKLAEFHDRPREWVWAANEACRIRTPLDDAYWERSFKGKNPEPFVM